jgi:hypothetical protein
MTSRPHCEFWVNERSGRWIRLHLSERQMVELYRSCSSHKGADVAKASCEGGAPTKVQLDHSVFTNCSPKYESLRLDADIARNPQQAGELGSFPRPSDRYIGKLEVFSPQNEYIWRASVPEQLLSPADIPAAHRSHNPPRLRTTTCRDRSSHFGLTGRPSRLVCTILKLPFRIVR